MRKPETLLGVVPIVGIRWWLVYENSLYGVGNFSVRLSNGRMYPGPRWHPGKPLKAACLGLHPSSSYKLYQSYHKGLDAPQLHCTCGIYAVRTSDLRPIYATQWGCYINPKNDIIQGEVFLWGSVIEHTEGWRAQYAQVKAFHEEYSCIQHDQIYQLADIYHVPVTVCER